MILEGTFFSSISSCFNTLLFVYLNSKILGDKHPETIIVMHNLAECLLASKNAADQEAAGKIQEMIISLVEPEEPNTVEEAAVDNPSPHVTINHSKSNKNKRKNK
jgi:hypothetical protein